MATALAPLVVMMGVTGCGKTAVGNLLARQLGAEFLEGDELHPARNLERMASGIALTEHDRKDWLLEIARQLADARAGRHALVVSCTALTRGYRDILRTASSQLAFVHIHAGRDLLAPRLKQRRDALAATALLDSQLAMLEPPGADERALTLHAALPPEQLAAQVAAWLGQGARSGR